MSGRGFPHLGRDPAPGDVELTRGVAQRVGALGAELGGIVEEVGGAHGDEWRGQAAEAFRATLRDELLPLLSKARDSFDRAGCALVGWVGTLAGFQAEAQALERVAAARQATLDAARRARTYSPSGTDVTTLARLDDNVVHATTAMSQLEHQADELNDRYLRAASSVAGELEQAERIAPEPGWLERVVESVRSWMEMLHAPWDLVAGDQWLELALVKGAEVTEGVEKAVAEAAEWEAGRWSEVSALAHDADLGLASWDDVAVAARGFTTDAQAAEASVNALVNKTSWIGKATAEGTRFGRFMSITGIAGDVLTVIDPPDKGVMGNVDRGVAFANGGLVVANMALDEFPVVGEVVIAGTGVYLAGDYAYHHWPWFHDACDTVGHAVATGAKAVWHWITG